MVSDLLTESPPQVFQGVAQIWQLLLNSKRSKTSLSWILETMSEFVLSYNTIFYSCEQNDAQCFSADFSVCFLISLSRTIHRTAGERKG